MVKIDKIYEIKVPVYVSEPVTTEPNSFMNITYDDMVNLIIKRIDEHNQAEKKIVAQQRNKTKRKEIAKLDYIQRSFNHIPALFIRMNAANTNLYDTYIQSDEFIELDKNDKVGSENNWLLLYPQIKGIDPGHYTCYWLIFVYADPHKDFNDITQSAKLFVRHILQLKLRHIKTQDVLKELKDLGTTPELKIRYTYLATDSNDIDVKYQNYVICGRFKKEKLESFANMPYNYTEEIIADESYKSEYHNRDIYATIGKKEYKIIKKRQLDEAKKIIEDVVEETFNMTSYVTGAELEPNTLYDIDFITDKLKPVIENYLANYA